MLCGASAHAATDDAQASFAQARAAFDADDFSRALTLFEQAAAAGMDGPAIHYNIGVAAYRSGSLARAERAFKEVARTPAMAALAHYNLGLTELKRGDEQAARKWIELAVQETTDERLAGLAARRLEGLPVESTPAVWSYYSRGGFGYDDNVALRSGSIDSSGSGESDAYAELLFAGSYSFGHWRADAGAGLLNYQSLDEFDQSAYSLGLAHGWSLRDWYLELGAYGAQLSLGGEVYERSAALAALATRTFSHGRRLRAQLRFNDVHGEGDFPGLTGSRTELGVQYDWSWQAWSFIAHTRAEFNNSEDEVFASRWIELGAEARYALSPRWGFLGDATLRRTRHPAEDPWEDRRATYQLGVTRTLLKQAQIFVRYQHEHNQSPIDGYDYSRNWIAASFEFWR